MTPAFRIVAVTSNLEANSHWLTRAETLHRVLRPAIPQPYDAYLRGMFEEGAEMAVLVTGEIVKSLAVYRSQHTTFHGYRFYLDDLVTDEADRGCGFGDALLSWCKDRAREKGCDYFDLESGVQRSIAHRFYFRQKLTIFAFGFTASLR